MYDKLQFVGRWGQAEAYPTLRLCRLMCRKGFALPAASINTIERPRLDSRQGPAPPVDIRTFSRKATGLAARQPRSGERSSPRGEWVCQKPARKQGRFAQKVTVRRSARTVARYRTASSSERDKESPMAIRVNRLAIDESVVEKEPPDPARYRSRFCTLLPIIPKLTGRLRRVRLSHRGDWPASSFRRPNFQSPQPSQCFAAALPPPIPDQSRPTCRHRC